MYTIFTDGEDKMGHTPAKTANTVTVGNATTGVIKFSNQERLSLIAGPCVIESRAHTLDMAKALREIAEQNNIGLVYKSSFDKANRTSNGSFRGVGIEEGLDILAEVRDRVGLPLSPMCIPKNSVSRLVLWWTCSKSRPFYVGKRICSLPPQKPAKPSM